VLAPADALTHLRLAVTVAGMQVDDFALPQERDVVVDGMRLHYLDWGAPGQPPLLFLHGGCLTAHTWDLVCLALRGDFRCVALDQRGHGDSEWSPTLDYGPDAHARDIAGLVAELGLARPVLIGHSLGGLNAMTHALAAGATLGAVVLVDVMPKVPASAVRRIADFVTAEPAQGTLEEFVHRAHGFNPRRDPRLLRYSLLHNLRELPDGRLTWKYDTRGLSPEYMSSIKGRLEGLPELTDSVRCPVLIVRGGQSEASSDDAAARFAASFRNGRWAKVDGAGHTVQGDDPRGLAAVLSSFLAEIELA
jgi:pimeloyl-ACP methyl ester carboxylesterase